jgi:uncharacterized membrane protein
MISNGIYALTNLMFLMLHFTEGKITRDQKENFIGWPLIALVVMLILSNYIISMRGAWQGIKNRCKKIKKNTKLEQERLKNGS